MHQILGSKVGFEWYQKTIQYPI